MESRELKDKASAFFTKGRFAKAAETYEEFCAMDKRDHQARLRCGDAWNKAGKKDKAIGAYSMAAEGFARDGFLPRAIAASKLVLEIDPSHKGVQKMLAELYAQKSGGARGGPARGSSPSAVAAPGQAAPGSEMEVTRSVSSPVTSSFTNRKDAIDLDAPIAAKPKLAGYRPAPVEAPSPMNRADALELPEYQIPMDDGPSQVGGMAATRGPTPQGREDAIEIDVSETVDTGPKALVESSIDIELTQGQPTTGEVEIPIEGQALTAADELPPELQMAAPLAPAVSFDVAAPPASFELDVPLPPSPSAPGAPIYELTEELPDPVPSAPVFELTDEAEAPTVRARPEVEPLDAPLDPVPPPQVRAEPLDAPLDRELPASPPDAPLDREPLQRAELLDAPLDREPLQRAEPLDAPLDPGPQRRAGALDPLPGSHAAPFDSPAAAPHAAPLDPPSHAASPAHAAPAHVAATPVDPGHAAPAHPEPSRAAPEHAAPAHVAPAHGAPVHAAPAQGATPVHVAAPRQPVHASRASALPPAVGDAASAPPSIRPIAAAEAAQPPGLKPRRVDSPAAPPSVPAASPSSSRIWLPPAFTPATARAEGEPPRTTVEASAPPPAVEEPSTELERSLQAFMEFDPDAPAPASVAPEAPRPQPSFTELDLDESDSLLHAVNAAAATAAPQAEVVEEAMEAEDATPQPGGLPKIALFSDLPEDAFIALFEKCPLQRFDEGQLVFEQGDKADAFYVICGGQVRVFRTDGGVRKDLATLDEGSFFGEMALLSEAPRSASVEAGSEDTQVLVISAEILKELSSSYPVVSTALKKFCRQRMLSNLMNQAALFAPFNKNDRRDLVQKFRARDVNKGDVLVKEGTASDGLYLVLSGEVEIEAKGRRIATLKEGQVFGEMSLLMRSPASATVRALRHTSLLRLPKHDFDSLILSHPQVLEHVSLLIDERKKADEKRSR